MMVCLDTIKQYLNAWSAYNDCAIVKTFAADGTYGDPAIGVISGDKIVANAKRLWRAFPDTSFEVVSLAEAG